MTRRLQLLLDEERYQRVAAAAQKQRVSVATVIRDAIDESLGDDGEAQQKRSEAARLILELTAVPEDYGPDWDAVKEIHEAREERLRDLY